MFRRFFICNFGGFFKGIAYYDFSAGIYAGTCRLCCRKKDKLFFNFIAYFSCKQFVVRCHNRLGNNVVFRLCKQIRRYPGRVGRTIGNNENFCRTSNHINSDFSEYHFFCGGNEFISRSYDNVNCRYAFCSVCHCGNCLRTAAGIAFFHAADIRGSHNSFIRIRFSAGKRLSWNSRACFFGGCLIFRVNARRSTQNNFLYAGCNCRSYRHNYSRNERKPPCRNIHAGFFYRNSLLPCKHSRRQLYFKIIKRVFLLQCKFIGKLV